MSKDVLLELVKQYDRIRTEHSALTKQKDEVSTQIKAMIGDKLDVPVDGYRVSYKYDSDKEVQSFNEAKMKKNDPNGYSKMQKLTEEIVKLRSKYTKTETVSGSRRLIIDKLED